MKKPRFGPKKLTDKEAKRLIDEEGMTLTDDEVADLQTICKSNLFLLHVAGLAKDCRWEIEAESRVPPQGVVVEKLKKTIQLALAVQNAATCLVNHVGSLDELTRAALHVGRRNCAEIPHAVLNEATALHALIDGAKNTIAERKGLPRGPRSSVAMQRAGVAVRALFLKHRLEWAVSAARENSIESTAVRVFHIVTGKDGRIERYLPHA